MFRSEPVVALVGPEELGVAEVGDEHELLARDPSAGEPGNDRLAADDQAIRSRVQGGFEPFGERDLATPRQIPERSGNGRPKILELEYEWHASEARGEGARDPGGERGGRSVDDVGSAEAKSGGARRERVRAVGKQPLPLREPLLVGDSQPNDVDAVDALPPPQETGWRGFAHGQPARIAGDHGHFVAALDEAACNRIGARRCGVARREELGVEVEDLHPVRNANWNGRGALGQRDPMDYGNGT